MPQLQTSLSVSVVRLANSSGSTLSFEIGSERVSGGSRYSYIPPAGEIPPSGSVDVVLFLQAEEPAEQLIGSNATPHRHRVSLYRIRRRGQAASAGTSDPAPAAVRLGEGAVEEGARAKMEGAAAVGGAAKESTFEEGITEEANVKGATTQVEGAAAAGTVEEGALKDTEGAAAVEGTKGGDPSEGATVYESAGHVAIPSPPHRTKPPFRFCMPAPIPTPNPDPQSRLHFR